jgi:hypothetical protein
MADYSRNSRTELRQKSSVPEKVDAPTVKAATPKKSKFFLGV